MKNKKAAKLKEPIFSPYAQFKVERVREIPAWDDLPTGQRPHDVVDYWRNVIAKSPEYDESQEHFVAIFLTGQMKIYGHAMVAKGDETEVHSNANLALRAAIIAQPAFTVLAHNHPQDSPKPSEADCMIWVKTKAAAKICSVNLLEGFIIGEKCTEYPHGYSRLSLEPGVSDMTKKFVRDCQEAGLCRKDDPTLEQLLTGTSKPKTEIIHVDADDPADIKRKIPPHVREALQEVLAMIEQGANRSQSPKTGFMDALGALTVAALGEIMSPINTPPEGRLERFKAKLEPYRTEIEKHGRTVEACAQDIYEASTRFDEQVIKAIGRAPWQHTKEEQVHIDKTVLKLMEEIAGPTIKGFAAKMEKKMDERPSPIRLLELNEWEPEPTPPPGWQAMRLDQIFTPEQFREVQRIMRQDRKNWEHKGAELKLYLKTIREHLPETLDPDFLGYGLEALWREGKLKNGPAKERKGPKLGDIMRAVKRDDCTGFCKVCGHEQQGCEPDARNYTCESCGASAVFGAEELLLEGL